MYVKMKKKDISWRLALLIVVVSCIIILGYCTVKMTGYFNKKEDAVETLNRGLNEVEEELDDLTQKMDELEARVESDSEDEEISSVSEVENLLKEGMPIDEVLKKTDEDIVGAYAWLFLEKGADVQVVHDRMAKGAIYMNVERLLAYGYDADKLADELAEEGGSALRLRIDEFVEAGYDIDKLASKLSITAIWLEADKLTRYGADIDILRNRILEDGDELLCSLVESGGLYPER